MDNHLLNPYITISPRLPLIMRQQEWEPKKAPTDRPSADPGFHMERIPAVLRQVSQGRSSCKNILSSQVAVGEQRYSSGDSVPRKDL